MLLIITYFSIVTRIRLQLLLPEVVTVTAGCHGKLGVYSETLTLHVVIRWTFTTQHVLISVPSYQLNTSYKCLLLPSLFYHGSITDLTVLSLTMRTFSINTYAHHITNKSQL